MIKYLVAFALIAYPALAIQPRRGPSNLLRNPDANQATESWARSRTGEVSVEAIDGNPAFVLRRGGSLSQFVTISEGNEDLHVVLIARAQSEYVHPDKAITDQPYIYGMAYGTDRNRIVGYLQGNSTLRSDISPNEWTVLWGIFHVPVGTTSISFDLRQGLRMGVRYTGSAARFDDVAVYAVTSAEAAMSIVRSYDPGINPRVIQIPFPRPG